MAVPQKIIFPLLLLLLSNALGAKTDTIYGNEVNSLGLKQGYWKKLYPNGNVAYKTYFVNNQPAGTMYRYYEDGKPMAIIEYTGNSQKPAAVQLFNTAGSLVATGFYINERQKQGLWQYFDKGLLTLQETYNDNEQLNGEQLHYYPQSEQLYERRRFANGVPTGLYEQWDEQGRMQFEMMYKDGIQEGGVRYYYPNNQIRIEGQYQNNLRAGKWTFYDIHGKILRSVEYTNGVAADQEAIDQMKSDELKRLEQNKGLYEEPETMMQEL
ncbi:hypothetical protein AGMMS4956_12400 [Bacteroidia bacterium]|nr:hypothetical protein AGMMS4956_12400 [Bacteroidia bacterium]